jgi:hypothetical protein
MLHARCGLVEARACSNNDVPEPGPKLTIVGETPKAGCRIARAGDYTYLEQNTKKRSPWTRLAKAGHEIWWEFDKRGAQSYTGRVLIDGRLYTVGEAKKTFGIR